MSHHRGLVSNIPKEVLYTQTETTDHSSARRVTLSPTPSSLSTTLFVTSHTPYNLLSTTTQQDHLSRLPINLCSQTSHLTFLLQVRSPLVTTER